MAKTNPSRLGKRRASEIIEAAAIVFASHGYHGATTQDIADMLGIRQASLYYYFGSKEEALEQVCMRGVEGYVERAAIIADGTSTARQKLASLVHNHLSPMTDRPAFVRVFQRERRHLPDASRRRVGRLARRYEATVERVVKAGIASGEFRADLDSRLTALALIGMCNAATAWYGVEPDSTVERVAAAFSELLARGVVAHAAPFHKHIDSRAQSVESRSPKRRASRTRASSTVATS